MIRILYILHTTDSYAGSTKAFLSLLDGLHPMGVHTGVVVPDKCGIYSILVKKGIPVYQLNYRPCVYPPTKSLKDVLLFLPRLAGRIFLNKKAAKQLANIAVACQADIIHTNTSVNDIGYYAAKRTGLPHVWHIREYAALDFHYYYYYYYRKQFLRKFKAPNSYTICITKQIQEYDNLAAWSNSRVIYDGVLSANQAVHSSEKSPYFLFAGRLEENKGIGDLLKAYAVYLNACQDPLPLRVAGDTSDQEYKEYLNTLVQTLHLEGYVSFLGMRPDVLALMQQARALIVPSLSEGFGFITAEAMFMGTLVIGNDTAGTKEQFDNGLRYTGHEIGLRYRTEQELVSLLLEVTSHSPDYYSTHITAGQATVCAYYSTEMHTENVFAFYQDILNRKTIV